MIPATTVLTRDTHGVCPYQVIGPLYFSHGPAVLEAVFASMEDWPAPCPGSLCPLPFLSETVMFQVPHIDMPPQVASKYRSVFSCISGDDESTPSVVYVGVL